MRGVTLLLAVSLVACGDDGDRLSRQECEAVIAHLVVLERMAEESYGPMCKYHVSCDGSDRRTFMNVCPRALSRREAHCYQRATTLTSADDCLSRAELDERIQSGGRGRGYGATSAWLGPGGGRARSPEDAALAELELLRTEACRCRDATCAERVEGRFEDLARRYGELDDAPPGLRDRAMRIAEESMKCLIDAMLEPDAGPTPQMVYPPPPPPGGSAMPSCDRYLAAMEAYLACDQIPQSIRDSTRDSLDSMRQSWAEMANLPLAARQAAEDGCAQAIDAIRQGAAAMGCTVP